MLEWLDRYGAVECGGKALSGKRHYFLAVKGLAYGVALSVVSLEAVEKIGFTAWRATTDRLDCSLSVARLRLRLDPD
jgi:hypothetical protein